MRSLEIRQPFLYPGLSLQILATIAARKSAGRAQFCIWVQIEISALWPSHPAYWLENLCNKKRRGRLSVYTPGQKESRKNGFTSELLLV
jgi:hypothetical protein